MKLSRPCAVFAVLCCSSALAGDPPLGFPDYTAASVVNSADGLPSLAPNTIVTVYGRYLAGGTSALTSAEMAGGRLPTTLAGTYVTILVGGIPANPYYASPTQINFLLPVTAVPGPTTFTIVVKGRAGPMLKLQLTDTAPALYLLDTQTVIAQHAGGSIVTQTKPARAGEVIVLYATGLGQTTPAMRAGEVPMKPARIVREKNLQVLLDGHPSPPGSVLYAGVAPGFAGLYQINLRLPVNTVPNPEIRIAIGQQTSIEGVHLPVQP